MAGLTVCLGVRARIVDLVITQNRLQTEQIILFEDDAYGLTRFEGEALPTLHALSGGRSVYSASFSTLVAPGLRVGFMLLPEGMADDLERMATETAITPALLSQATVFEFIERGAFEPHLERLRAGLRERRDAMSEALSRHIPGARWSSPEGGLFVWVELPGSPDGREVLRRAQGVTALDGTKFAAVSSYLRLSFGFASPDAIETGVERIAEALAGVAS